VEDGWKDDRGGGRIKRRRRRWRTDGKETEVEVVDGSKEGGGGGRIERRRWRWRTDRKEVEGGGGGQIERRQRWGMSGEKSKEEVEDGSKVEEGEGC